MKKIYVALFSLISTSAIAQFGQIANGDFESWTDTPIYDTTVDWRCTNAVDFNGIPLVFQSTDAQDGLSSIELSAVEYGSLPDTAFGYAYHGSDDFFTGIPYSDVFDEVQVYFKSNMPIGDSAYVLLQRFLGGIPQGLIIVPIANGNQGTWTLGSAIIPAGTQDSLWIGLVIGNPFNGALSTPGSWVRFDNVQLLNSSVIASTVPDYSFENWGSVNFNLADNWFTTTTFLIGTGLENVLQTTDANTGTYAMELSTLLDPSSGDTINAFTSVGAIDITGPTSTAFAPIAYDASPTDFSGMNKYAPAGIDTAYIQLLFFAGGSQIGTHTEALVAQSTYTAFTAPLTISGVPDSMSLVIYSGDNPGSVLIIDDFSLSGNNVGIEEISTSDYSIYPNPASNKLNIEVSNPQISSYELVNIYGALIVSGKIGVPSTIVDISRLAAGTYFIKIGNEFSHDLQKIVIR